MLLDNGTLIVLEKDIKLLDGIFTTLEAVILCTALSERIEKIIENDPSDPRIEYVEHLRTKIEHANTPAENPDILDKYFPS